MNPAQAEIAEISATLAAEFQALEVPDPWRAVFDAWALERGLTAELRRATIVALLRARVFGAVQRHEARRR